MATFIDFQNLFLVLSFALFFSFLGSKFTIKKMPQFLTIAFLIAGLIIGLGDLISFFQNNATHENIYKGLGVVLLAPFYGLLFGALSYFIFSIRKD